MGKRSIASVVRVVLEAAWWAIAIGLGVLVIILVCSFFFVDTGGARLTMSLPVAVEVDRPVQSLRGESDARFEKLRGNLLFPARRGAFFSGSLTLVVLAFGFLLWVVTQLRHVFRSLSQRLPFVADNARRIRWIGWAVIFGELARAALVLVWSYYTSLHFTVDGMRFAASADLNLITIVGGLAILAIAEVFEEGARLQEDQSLTI